MDQPLTAIQRKQLLTAHINLPTRNSIDSICNLYTPDSPVVKTTDSLNTSYVDEELNRGGSSTTGSAGTVCETLPGYLSYLAIDTPKKEAPQESLETMPTLKVKKPLRIRTDFVKPIAVGTKSVENGKKTDPKPASNSGTNERIRNRESIDRKQNFALASPSESSRMGSNSRRPERRTASKSSKESLSRSANNEKSWTTGRHERALRPAATKFPKRPSEPHLPRLADGANKLTVTTKPLMPAKDLVSISGFPSQSKNIAEKPQSPKEESNPNQSKAQSKSPLDKVKPTTSGQPTPTKSPRSPTPSTCIPIQTRILPVPRKPLFPIEDSPMSFTQNIKPIIHDQVSPRESITPKLIHDVVAPRKPNPVAPNNTKNPKPILKEVPERRESLFTRDTPKAQKPFFGSQQRPMNVSPMEKKGLILPPIPADSESETYSDSESRYSSNRDSRYSRYSDDSDSSSVSSVSVKKKKFGFFRRLFGRK